MIRLTTAGAAVLLTACVGGVEPDRAPAPATPSGGGSGASPAERSAALARVVTAGASVTGGFGVGTDMAHALQAALPGVPEIRTRADLFFFGDPETMGEKLVSDLREREPTLVVALDFLFWYGYGDSFSGDELAERLERLEQGLRQLERFDCPVVVGDFPDMETAIGRMLREAQVPAPSVLEALNRRTVEWADSRDDVHLLPWSAYREILRELSPGGIRSKHFELSGPVELLLADRLHPSLEGQAAIALWTLELLVEAGIVRPDEVLFSFEELVERLKETRERLFSQSGR